MKALVVYAYTNFSRNGQIEIDNKCEYFSGNNPTEREISKFKENYSMYPDRCHIKIINIIKLDE